jgi:putative ABC transport system permease protein
VDAGNVTKATTLRDSYFVGGTAKENMARLRARPDGVLVSKETISDYSLHHGDLLKLRVLDHKTGTFHVVPFHVVGTVQEFPSAPRDSFMIANIGYLQAADHTGGPNVVFAKSSSDPPAVARRVQQATRADGAIVKNIHEQAAQTVSSITTVDLKGISKIEQAFAIALAAGAMWLFVTVALAERRHELATMAAVGASLRTIRAFLRSEAVLVLVAGLVLASLLGFLLAEMLVAMLQHVFDPPPDALAVPWRFLGELTAGAILGAGLALLAASRAVKRLPLGAILREQ